MIKASFIVLLFASALSFSCSKALNVEPEPLLQKPGYDHSGKPVSSLTAAQKKDFFSFMQEAGRVEDSAGILNSTTPGTQPRSDDAKTQKMASQMGKCKMTSVDTSSLSNPSRYEISASASGNECPVQLNVAFSAIKQDAKVIFNFSSKVDILDEVLKASNDVIKQSSIGSGSNLITGSANDATEQIEYQVSTAVVSLSRGGVAVSSFLKAKLHIVNNQIQTAQIEENNEFQFSDHFVLLQRTTVKSANAQIRSEYFFNGASLNAESYNQLRKGLGYHVKIVSKF